jgi:nucleoside-triphosphatase
MTILAITGDPGIGKSMVIMYVAEELKKRSLKVGGIISKEVRSNNTRIGFEFIDLTTNERMTLASTVGNGPRVGRYVVNLDGCIFASKQLISAIENSDVIIWMSLVRWSSNQKNS